MANTVKGNLIVSSIGGSIKINNTPINNILVNKTYSFDKERGELVFTYDNISGVVSPEKVEIVKYRSNGAKLVSGTNSIAGARGRFVRCKNPVDRKSDTINISRLWMIVYHLEMGNIVIADVDKYFLNHLDNKGNEEGCIDTKEGIAVHNYELCTKELNDLHADIWYKLLSFGVQAKFSAYDSLFIDLVKLAEDLNQLLIYMNLKNLTPADYRISEVA